MATTATGTTPAATGTMRTGMTGIRPPQPKQSFFSKALAWWNALSAKQKWMAGSAVAALLIVAIVVGQVNKATAYVPLYENVLSPEDLTDVTQALTEMGIPYAKTQDGHLTVPPSKRVDALVALTKEGIPKHPFEDMASGSTGESHEQFTEEQQLMLERDLTMVLRQYNEVADADVKLVIPTDTDDFFGQKEEAKAAVMLKLKAGYDSLPLNEAQSIVNLVAASVPHLKPENVQLTDTTGRLLSDILKNQKDLGVPDNEIAIKKNYQDQYESQIRQILDPVLGPGKYALAVNVDLNWNPSETQSQTVGNPELNTTGRVGVEEQTSDEKYNKKSDGDSGMKQLGFYADGSNSGGAPGGYEKKDKLAKYDYDKQVTTTKVTPGQVVRITASVMADQNISPSAQRTLAAEIKNAIGMNNDRGDSVAFGTLPFYQNEIAEMSNEMNQPAFLRENSPSSISAATGARIIGALAILAIAFIAFYIFKQQKAKAEKSQLVLAAGPTATVSEISDLVNEKTGKVNIVQQAPRANQTEKLELLAKEKPTKVAELLKTTWLAEK